MGKLMAFEHQLVPFILIMSSLDGLRYNDIRKMQVTLACLKDKVDIYLYNRLIRLGWSANPFKNKHMCVKGSFVFLFSWENMTNGHISTDHPTRVSTDTSTYIKKKYLVLILSTTEEGFDFLIITRKDGGPPTAALKVDPKMYMLIENHWAQSDVPEGEQAPVCVVITSCLDPNAMLHLRTRYMKSKNSLLRPARAQLDRSERNHLADVMKPLFDDKLSQLGNAPALCNVKKSINIWKGEPLLNSSEKYTFGEIPESLKMPPFQPQWPGSLGPGSEYIEQADTISKLRAQLVQSHTLIWSLRGDLNTVTVENKALLRENEALWADNDTLRANAEATIEPATLSSPPEAPMADGLSCTSPHDESTAASTPPPEMPAKEVLPPTSPHDNSTVALVALTPPPHSKPSSSHKALSTSPQATPARRSKPQTSSANVRAANPNLQGFGQVQGKRDRAEDAAVDAGSHPAHKVARAGEDGAPSAMAARRDKAHGPTDGKSGMTKEMAKADLGDSRSENGDEEEVAVESNADNQSDTAAGTEKYGDDKDEKHLLDDVQEDRGVISGLGSCEWRKLRVAVRSRSMFAGQVRRPHHDSRFCQRRTI